MKQGRTHFRHRITAVVASAVTMGAWQCRFQSEKCGRTIGSCLDNQLPQLQEVDAERERQGLQPLHLASRYSQAGVQTLRLNLTAAAASQQVQLAFPVPQITTSLITLEVAADSLTFVQNAAPGEVRQPPRRGRCSAARRYRPRAALLNGMWLCVCRL